MTIQSFASKNPHLFWSVKDPKKLSTESIVEGILERGDFDDFKKIMGILGIKKLSEIFTNLSSSKRKNMSSKTIHYFKLYFKAHA